MLIALEIALMIEGGNWEVEDRLGELHKPLGKCKLKALYIFLVVVVVALQPSS